MAENPSPRPALVDRKLFAGPKIRRLRRELRLTQAAMADALGVSTSYLNLIERDQRPISAQILLRLVEVFDIDPRGLAGDEEARAYAQLREVFSDPFLPIIKYLNKKLKKWPASALWRLMRLRACSRPIVRTQPQPAFGTKARRSWAR